MGRAPVEESDDSAWRPLVWFLERDYSEPVQILGWAGLLLIGLGLWPLVFLGHPSASFASPNDVGVADGRVTESFVTQHPGRRPRASTSRLRVAFEVDGAPHEVVGRHQFTSTADADRYADLTPEGSQLPVYYLKADPDVAFTDPERFGNGELILAFLACIPAGLALLWGAWRLDTLARRAQPDSTTV